MARLRHNGYNAGLNQDFNTLRNQKPGTKQPIQVLPAAAAAQPRDVPADVFENLREEGNQDRKSRVNPMKGSQGL